MRTGCARTRYVTGTVGGGTELKIARAIDGYLDHLAVERGLARHTVTSYRRDLARYRELLTALSVSELPQVEQWHLDECAAVLRSGNETHPPLSAASVARAIIAIRGLHRFALREGWSNHDPAAAVRPPTIPGRLPKAISIDQVERLLYAADIGGDALGLRDRALLELLYGTGARISEAIGLAVDDLDRDAALVRLRGKGGRTRLVPVGSYALAAVESYLVRARPLLASRGKGEPTLFLGARGTPLSRQGAWLVLKAVAERAGLSGISPHTLRHSFATHVLDGGADVRVVQELLGHASVTTTQVYTLVTVEKLREVYATSHPRALG